jgi:hypothetical protein
MSAKSHAVLSASSSHRWLNCPPSVRLCENYEDKVSNYAAEGTEAHELCEYKLRLALGFKSDDPKDSLTYYSPEMEECTTGYADFILELLESAKQTCNDPLVLIEQRVNFTRWVKNGFGTADCIIIADSILHVVDYKHGQGVLVEAEDNPQMKLYALGALELFDGIYDIDKVNMTIYQPRRDNISTSTVLKESLYQWADEVLKPAAKLAYNGEGEFHCGEWCVFCKAKYDCRARAAANLALAAYDFRLPSLLTDSEIEDILAKLENLKSWTSDIKEYALHRALSGKQWRGWKLVEGRSNRRYIDENAVADIVTKAGYDPYEKTLLGVTAMERMLGKVKFAELMDGLIEKPHGKPTLVPASDKRPAINTVDFMEES